MSNPPALGCLALSWPNRCAPCWRRLRALRAHAERRYMGIEWPAKAVPRAKSSMELIANPVIAVRLWAWPRFRTLRLWWPFHSLSLAPRGILADRQQAGCLPRWLQAVAVAVG